jgi:Ca2+-binding EF-hand superfamily protein
MVPLIDRDRIWTVPFRSFDPGNTGKIGELQFRKIMKSKEAIPDEDVEEMLSGGQIFNINA